MRCQAVVLEVPGCGSKRIFVKLLPKNGLRVGMRSSGGASVARKSINAAWRGQSVLVENPIDNLDASREVAICESPIIAAGKNADSRLELERGGCLRTRVRLPVPPRVVLLDQLNEVFLVASIEIGPVFLYA